jgi:SAM-dependent methyltransferase
MSVSPSGVLADIHEKLVFTRRVAVLSDWFAKLAPPSARVLDVGCGDGLLSALIKRKRPDLQLHGIDVLQRAHTHIPVEIFDGSRIPYGDGSFDIVMFSDVLHHTADPSLLQSEAHRVARQCLLIKDHYREGMAAGTRLRLMDWLGNARFGVALPYNYWTVRQWHDTWLKIGLHPEEMVTRLGLYPIPADWIFGAQLHFVARLRVVR